MESFFFLLRTVRESCYLQSCSELKSCRQFFGQQNRTECDLTFQSITHFDEALTRQGLGVRAHGAGVCKIQVAIMGDKYDDDDDGPSESVLDKDMVRVCHSSTQ